MKKAAEQNTGSRVVEKELTIKNKLGIHARPAALFVKTAGRFRSDITVEKDGNRVSGKSIMGLMTLEGYQGSKLRVRAEGEDAVDAIKALEELVEQGFYED